LVWGGGEGKEKLVHNPFSLNSRKKKKEEKRTSWFEKERETNQQREKAVILG